MRRSPVKMFRFRLLTLIVFVAITALASWGYTLKRRSAEFASKASIHLEILKQLHLRFFFGGNHLTGEDAAPQATPDFAYDVPISERQLRDFENYYGYGLTTKGEGRRTLLLLWFRYEAYLHAKYRRASKRPWFSPGPDPPEPPAGPVPPADREWWMSREWPIRIADYLKIIPNVPE